MGFVRGGFETRPYDFWAQNFVPLHVLERMLQSTQDAWIPASLIRSGTGLGRNDIGKGRPNGSPLRKGGFRLSNEGLHPAY